MTSHNAALTLPAEFRDGVIDHARAEFPNEACGLLAGTGGTATRMFRMANAERSPVLYRMEPREQLRVFREIDDDGLELVAIYHSHTRSPAYPSETDVRLAYYPDSAYLIVSLADAAAPDLRAFRIVERAVTEVDVHVTGALLG